MDQSAKLEQFLLLAKNARGKSAAEVINRATEEPGIYGFGELLDIVGIKELKGTELEPAIQLLELFCYGTWTDYKGVNSQLSLSSQQQLKLKQLTVVSLAAQSKEIPYSVLMSQLDIKNVRELEDLLISDCYYSGLLKGKLDQKQRCLHVHEVIARDVKAEAIPSLVQGLGNWLRTSQSLLSNLGNNMGYMQEAAESAKALQSEMEANIEAERNKYKSVDKDGEMMMEETGTLDMMDVEDRSFAHGHQAGGRSKRRR